MTVANAFFVFMGAALGWFAAHLVGFVVSARAKRAPPPQQPLEALARLEDRVAGIQRAMELALKEGATTHLDMLEKERVKIREEIQRELNRERERRAGYHRPEEMPW